MVYTGLVEKGIAEIGDYVTAGGARLKGVRIGYTTLGRQEADRPVILVPSLHNGTSHFAGYYRDPLTGLPDEKKGLGFWSKLTGPGLALDPERYFIIGIDGLSAFDLFDPTIVTTGPSTPDPDSGQPYGLNFPRLMLQDQVRIQHLVLSRLGIHRLHAVVGGSMGGVQAFEWAARYPDMVGRFVASVAGPCTSAWSMMKYREARLAIMADPAWKQGDYYETGQPLAGLRQAFRLFTQDILSPHYINTMKASRDPKGNGLRPWADPARNPFEDWSADFSSAAWLDAKASARAAIADANHFLYIQRALELFSLGAELADDGTIREKPLAEAMRQITSPALLLPATDDEIVPLADVEEARDLMTAQGGRVDYHPLKGMSGHITGIFGLDEANDIIDDFLTRRLL